MMCRRVAALFLWLGLIGLASPALACASLVDPPADCCPEGAPGPCKNTGQTGVALCCVSLPPSAPLASATSARPTTAPADSSGSPDPIVLAAWLLTVRANSADTPAVSFETAPRVPDGTLTYLRTGRLRL